MLIAFLLRHLHTPLLFDDLLTIFFSIVHLVTNGLVSNTSFVKTFVALDGFTQWMATCSTFKRSLPFETHGGRYHASFGVQSCHRNCVMCRRACFTCCFCGLWCSLELIKMTAEMTLSRCFYYPCFYFPPFNKQTYSIIIKIQRRRKLAGCECRLLSSLFLSVCSVVIFYLPRSRLQPCKMQFCFNSTSTPSTSFLLCPPHPFWQTVGFLMAYSQPLYRCVLGQDTSPALAAGWGWQNEKQIRLILHVVK